MKKSLRHKAVPRRLQPILWSRNVRRLDIRRDRPTIIHRVLAYGSLIDLRWLFRTYSKIEITRVFRSWPQPLYTPAAFHFAATTLLKQNFGRKDRYVKTMSEHS